MAEPSFAFGKQWHGRCFVCGAISPQYEIAERLCKQCVDRYRHHQFFRAVSDLGECFVTIVPEPVVKVPNDALNRGFSDLLLRSGAINHDPKDFLRVPFPSDPCLPCGQPVLFEDKRLATFSGFGRAWTLDLSPYIWSGTLKDLRSWAVLSVAIEQNISHLAVWTAGNAGFSLAKLVHRWNAAQRNGRAPKTVHCLVDAFASPEIVVTLRSLQCRVAPISTGSGAVLSREQVFHVVSSIAEVGTSYWQVTDGWDGVGVFMYSLLARQCLALIRDQLRVVGLSGSNIYLVLPVGTGNLLLGFVDGARSVGEGRCKVVATVPFGDNMMTPFLPKENDENHLPHVRRVAPVAPKLTGFYSPLSPCLWHLTLNRDFSDRQAVEFIEVDRAAQIEAAARVFSPPEERTIAAEPSALIAFGALKQLAQRIRDYGEMPEQCVVLVVNSGFGIMGLEETEFYTKSIFAFR